MNKSAKKDLSEHQQPQKSSSFQHPVLSKLILKNLLLDSLRKGLLISIKSWKCKSILINTNQISDELETIATAKKYNEKQKQLLWNRLEKCLPKNNKYFQRMELQDEERRDARKQFWHKIYRRHPVKEIYKHYVNDIPSKYFLRQDLQKIKAPISPNLALSLQRLHNLRTLDGSFLYLVENPDVIYKASQNIEKKLKGLQSFRWLGDLPVGKIPSRIFNLRELKITSDLEGSDLLEIFNTACTKSEFKRLEYLDIRYSFQNTELDLGFLNYLDLKHFGISVYQSTLKNAEALKSQDQLTSLRLELIKSEHIQLINSIKELKRLEEIHIETSSLIAMSPGSAQIINGLNHLRYIFFYIQSNKKNISFYENLKLSVPHLSMRVFLSLKTQLNELEACGMFLNTQTNLEKLNFEGSPIRPETLKILKASLPKMAKLRDLRIQFNGHSGLSDKDYASFTEVFPTLTNIEYLELIFLGKSIVNKEITGIFESFSKIKRMKVFKFTTNFLSVDEKGLQVVIDFVKTREKSQFREIYIYPDAYKKSTFELVKALYRFQGLSVN